MIVYTYFGNILPFSVIQSRVAGRACRFSAGKVIILVPGYDIAFCMLTVFGMSPQLSHKTKLTAGNTVSYCAIGHRSIANIWIQSVFEEVLQS